MAMLLSGDVIAVRHSAPIEHNRDARVLHCECDVHPYAGHKAIIPSIGRGDIDHSDSVLVVAKKRADECRLVVGGAAQVHLNQVLVMQRQGAVLKLITYDALINACAKVKQPKQALEFVEAIMQELYRF